MESYTKRSVIRLTTVEIAAIERALGRGERLELMATKEGIKITRIRRENLKPDK